MKVTKLLFSIQQLRFLSRLVSPALCDLFGDVHLSCSPEMSLTEFLRRFSVESNGSELGFSNGVDSRRLLSPSGSSSRDSESAREARSPRRLSEVRGSCARRSRLVQSIDSARRRFSLQPNGITAAECAAGVGMSLALPEKMRRNRQGVDISSLPDLHEVEVMRGEGVAIEDF